MKRKIFTKSDPLLPLIKEPVLGGKYHVAWGNSNGVVGKVVAIDFVGKKVNMVSPKSGLHWKSPVKWEDLRHLRKTQYKIENQCQQ